jgi:hypothetical protein
MFKKWFYKNSPAAVVSSPPIIGQLSAGSYWCLEKIPTDPPFMIFPIKKTHSTATSKFTGGPTCS